MRILSLVNYFHQCVHKNIDNEFASSQTGGRIVKFDNNHILSTGEYRLRHLAQNKDSVNGKMIMK